MAYLLGVYIIEEDLGKVNYCLTILKPKYYPADEYIRIYCILHFNLEGSKRHVQEQTPEDYMLHEHWLEFQTGRYESYLEIQVDKKEAEACGWLVTLESEMRIYVEDVNILNINYRSSQTLHAACFTSDIHKPYPYTWPPRFVLKVSARNATCHSTINLTFKGAKRYVYVTVPLRLVGDDDEDQHVLYSTTEEEKHIAAVQKAMEERGKLDHTIVHGVFVGPARSGKNSLMERLLGRMPSSVSPSTGVAESIVQVKVIQKSATLTANVKELTWSVMDYDDEAIKLMVINIESQNKAEVFYQNETSHGNDVDEIQSGTLPNTPSVTQPSPTQLHVLSNPPTEIFIEAVKNKGYEATEALKQHFETTWSLYLTNTGGQMEFQEVLPLLVSGPSIFFFTFRLDRDLHEYYTIEYELSDGKRSYPYTSTLSTIDGMLQTLASISAMGTFIYSGLHRRDKPLRPKVFFVGTHKDLLDSKLVDNHIARVDQELQKIIRSTCYYKDLVEHASESQLIFTVSNFSESDLDFKHIRVALQRVITRMEFQMTSPAHWLVFSLALRKLNDRVISYDLCLEIARRCGLADNELDEALHFIHSKMGLIRYFPHEHIKSLVFIDPQFLFDKVTELIVSTFTFEKVAPYEMEQFRHKGIFSLEKLDEVSNSSTIMSTFQFGKLLERLRIIAPLKVANEVKYFLPCVLAHTRKSDSCYYTPVPTLLIIFQCGYIPKGALIKYLIANEMESPMEWTPITEKIFKNEVSFCVGPYDTFMLKIFPTHFKITCIPDPQFSDDERDDCPVKETCNVALKAIDSGIKTILQDLNYIKTHHCVTFPCQADVCKGSHPAQLNWYGGSPRTLQCNILKKRLKLPESIHFWEPALQAVYEGQQNLMPPPPIKKLSEESETFETCLNEADDPKKQLAKHRTKCLQNQTSEGIGSQTEISIEEAAEKACIRPDILLKECSSVVSLDLAKFCVDWKLIGRRAGLTEGDLTAVDGDNRTVEEKRVGMMEKWKSKFAYKATYRTFIEALLEEGRCADAIEACKAIQAAEDVPVKPELRDLLKELYSTKAADKWEDIGIMLGIGTNELDAIKTAGNQTSQSCLREILKLFLQKDNPPPSWAAIVEALEFLGEEPLARSVRLKYCNSQCEK